MSNSSLVKYKKISPNQYGKRNHKIDTITIHCVCGQCSIETLGEIFSHKAREASSNYGVGPDGRVGMYVEEDCASWCSSNYANDQRAVTIEVASDINEPCAVKDAAYKGLIELVTDICKRNGIKKLVWSNSKTERVNHLNGCNMTVHRDYANKSCPGEYLYKRQGDIAKKVNEKLAAASLVTAIVQQDSYLYGKDYKDPIGDSVKKKEIKKGSKVKVVKDNKKGWSKVKYKDKEYWMLNSNLNGNLSKCKTVVLNKDRKCYKIVDGKLKKDASTLKKGTKITDICKISSGKYKDYSYIGKGENRYYIKNL